MHCAAVDCIVSSISVSDYSASRTACRTYSVSKLYLGSVDVCLQLEPQVSIFEGRVI